MSAPQQPAVGWQLITDAPSLHEAARNLAAGTGPIAIDTERASGFRYRDRAYLVQAYRREAGVYLFDPTTIADFSPLREAILDEEWVLHAASHDLPYLRQLQLQPDRLFDTELAARLLGFEQVGLGNMLERLLDVRLAKAYSAADWSTRPLPDAWLEYAAYDVLWLPALRDVLALELTRQHKRDIATAEFKFISGQPQKPAPREPWRKLAHGKLHTQRQLAIVRELWHARDSLAREQDVAPSRLLPDASLVAAAIANPYTRQQLAANTAFRGRASRSELDRWWQAVRRGKTAELPALRVQEPAATMPHHRSWARRSPAAAARLAAARAALAVEAERQHLPAENLLSPATVRTLSWNPPTPINEHTVADQLASLGARPWQCAMTASILANAITLPDDPDRLTTSS